MILISAETVGSFPELQNSGLFHRQSIAGREKDLVETFASTCLSPPPIGQYQLTFVEPRLASGFPDLVVVFVDGASAKDWSHDRAKLSKREICILHHITTAGAQKLDRLEKVFPRGLRSSLRKLESASLLHYSRARWRVVGSRKLFAIKRIVAIEAKIDGWRAGLRQATMNRWFASESFLLLPRVPKSAMIATECRKGGVGLLTIDTPLSRPIIRPKRQRQPGSYASWLFNEWVCRIRNLFTTSATLDEALRHDSEPKDPEQHVLDPRPAECFDHQP